MESTISEIMNMKNPLKHGNTIILIMIGEMVNGQLLHPAIRTVIICLIHSPETKKRRMTTKMKKRSGQAHCRNRQEAILRLVMAVQYRGLLAMLVSLAD